MQIWYTNVGQLLIYITHMLFHNSEKTNANMIITIFTLSIVLSRNSENLLLKKNYFDFIAIMSAIEHQLIKQIDFEDEITNNSLNDNDAEKVVFSFIDKLYECCPIVINDDFKGKQNYSKKNISKF